MARYFVLIAVAVLLVSCAQIGTISGGERDNAAPAPIADKVVPENASTFMVQKEVIIPFDEYFSLQNPSQTIQLIPPHANISAKLKRKTLILSWDEDLRNNTTYAIYMNRAIKDLAEGNDSIMQYVFSTGATLDSLRLSTRILDARTSAPVENVTCVLYDDKNELVNFAQSNKKGFAEMRYLSPGKYKPLFFIDENKDLEYQESEAIGFPLDSMISIDSNLILEPIYLFQPQLEVEIEDITYSPPSSYIVKTSEEVEAPSFEVSDVLLDSSKVSPIDKKNFQLFVEPDSIFSGKVVMHFDGGSDTSKYRLLQSQVRTNTLISCASKTRSFAPSETTTFIANDLIEAIDTSQITILNADSLRIYPNITWSINEIYFDLQTKKTAEFTISFNDEAVRTRVGQNKLTEVLVTLNSKKKYGRLIVDVSDYEEPLVLHLFKGKKVMEIRPVEETTEAIVFEELIPGEYHFEVVRDSNGDGKWNTGDYSSRRQAERIDIFSTQTKVRANWDVELRLEPLENE